MCELAYFSVSVVAGYILGYLLHYIVNGGIDKLEYYEGRYLP